MPKFQFQKLVRDKIIDHQLASGAQPTHHRLEGKEYIAALIAKLSEEAGELAQTSAEQLAEEFADVQQVLDDLREHLQLSPEAVAIAQQRKNDQNGAFKNGDYVEYVEVAEDDDWAAYYRAHPERYPEIS